LGFFEAEYFFFVEKPVPLSVQMPCCASKPGCKGITTAIGASLEQQFFVENFYKGGVHKLLKSQEISTGICQPTRK